MSAEIWRSEVVTYGFMILNVLGVAAALVWCWRHGLLDGPDVGAMPGGNPNSKEKVHE